MVWDSNTPAPVNTITREEAIQHCIAKAKEEGINGAFKVFYDGRMIANPSDLPDTVIKDKLVVSIVTDNARG